MFPCVGASSDSDPTSFSGPKHYLSLCSYSGTCHQTLEEAGAAPFPDPWVPPTAQKPELMPPSAQRQWEIENAC
jgi:hypothetical protein